MFNDTILLLCTRQRGEISHLHVKYPLRFKPCVQWTPTSKSEKKKRQKENEVRRQNETYYQVFITQNYYSVHQEIKARGYTTSHLFTLGATCLGLKANSHIACRAAKGLDCVFPISFTQCGLVWFTLAMPCHAHAFLKATSQGHGTARHGHAMACVN